MSDNVRTERSFTRAVSGLVSFCIYAYLLAVLVVLAILYFTGDRWWFGTVLLYGPRWIYAFPMIVFLPLAALWRRQWLWPLGLVALIVSWPVMGLNVSTAASTSTVTPDLRVSTFNVERWEVMGDEFLKFLETEKPDIAAVQECASPRRFKKEMPDHWFTQSAGSSIVISRHPISRCEVAYRGKEINGLYCVVETPLGSVGFANVDLLTPRRALKTILNRETIFDLSQVGYAQERIAKRWDESEKLSLWIQAFPEELKIIAGDFNLTVDSPIYRKVWSDYQNAYSHTTFGYGNTKKTRINIFRYKSRIDHVLSTPRLKPLRARVGDDYGSDHLPIIAEFVRN